MESSFYKDDESSKDAWAFNKNTHGFVLNQQHSSSK